MLMKAFDLICEAIGLYKDISDMSKENVMDFYKILFYIFLAIVIFFVFQLLKNYIKKKKSKCKSTNNEKSIKTVFILQIITILLVLGLVIIMLCGIIGILPPSTPHVSPTPSTVTVSEVTPSPTPNLQTISHFSKWWKSTLDQYKYAVCWLPTDKADVYSSAALDSGPINQDYIGSYTDYTDEIHLYDIVIDQNTHTFAAYIDYPINNGNSRKTGYIQLHKLINIDSETTKHLVLQQNTPVYRRPYYNSKETKLDHLNAGQPIFYLGERNQGKWKQILYCDKYNNWYIYWINEGSSDISY